MFGKYLSVFQTIFFLFFGRTENIELLHENETKAWPKHETKLRTSGTIIPTSYMHSWFLQGQLYLLLVNSEYVYYKNRQTAEGVNILSSHIFT